MTPEAQAVIDAGNAIVAFCENDGEEATFVTTHAFAPLAALLDDWKTAVRIFTQNPGVDRPPS